MSIQYRLLPGRAAPSAQVHSIMSGKCKSLQGTRLRFKLSQGCGIVPLLLDIAHKLHIALFKLSSSGARTCSKPIPGPRAKLQDASGSNIRSPLMKIRLHAIPMNTIPCGGRAASKRARSPPSSKWPLPILRIRLSLSLPLSARPSVCSLQFDHLY